GGRQPSIARSCDERAPRVICSMIVFPHPWHGFLGQEISEGSIAGELGVSTARSRTADHNRNHCRNPLLGDQVVQNHWSRDGIHIGNPVEDQEERVQSASEFEELKTRYSSDPQAREKAKGYTDLWTTGRRELFRVA